MDNWNRAWSRGLFHFPLAVDDSSRLGNFTPISHINYHLTSFLTSFLISRLSDSRKFASLFESPLTERIRKRRAFADSRLMSAPILMKIPSPPPPQQQQQSPYLIATPASFIPLKPLILPPFEFAQRSLQLELTSQPATSTRPPSKPKLSFSIESIIGVK